MSRLVEPEKLAGVAGMAGHAEWPRATGAGRVFEAAGALLGLAVVNGYEGEGAARFEALAARAPGPVEAWPEVPLSGDGVLPSAALLAAAARRALAGEDTARIAAGFHVTFCRLACELTQKVVPAGVRVVALGGGCLVNRLLRRGLGEGLSAAGFEPLLPVRLPAGDGGLSYGQAVVGAVAAARGVEPRLKGER
jgi:hydrogenase maturation protein HypF